MGPFKRNPMASEVVEAFFALLSEEEIQSFYNPEATIIDKDIRDVIKSMTPNRRARYSMKKCLKIAKEEFQGIKGMGLADRRFELLVMFRKKLFRRRF